MKSDLRKIISTQNQQNRTTENGFRHRQKIRQNGHQKIDFDTQNQKMDFDTKSVNSDLRQWISTQHQPQRTSYN